MISLRRYQVINGWMAEATKELEDIKNAAGSMLPEDRVARTMDLQEDIASKVYMSYIYISIYLSIMDLQEDITRYLLFIYVYMYLCIYLSWTTRRISLLRYIISIYLHILPYPSPYPTPAYMIGFLIKVQISKSTAVISR